jgi:competence protein ComEA
METIKNWLRDYWGIGVIAIAILGFMWWQGKREVALTPIESSSSLAVSASTTSSTSVAQLSSSGPKAGFVHVKGAVAKPGLYPVDGTTRWDAVVKAAGGLTAAADISGVNLAAIANDQESLLIPVKGEAAPVVAPSGVAGASQASGEDGATLVNLNTATEAELQTLSGVGPKKAADIIAYRDANGGFKSVEELKEVSGIGDKTYERLSPLVTVGP